MLLEVKKEFPNFEVIKKEDSKLMRILFEATLMRLWCPNFMLTYTTVFAGKAYMPEKFIGTLTGYEILRHERVHLRDAKKYPIIFELSYLLFLPTVFSMRAFWEFRAYCESLKAQNELYGYISTRNLNFYIDQFVGSSYFFMFPFKKTLRRKFLECIDREGLTLK